MVKVTEFSEKQVNKMKAYLTNYSAKPEDWNGKTYWGYLNKTNLDSLKDKPSPLSIIFTVPDDMDTDDKSADYFKKVLRRFKNKLNYCFSDTKGMYKLELHKSGKVHAHILLGGDSVPNREWVVDALKEGYQHDASKS